MRIDELITQIEQLSQSPPELEKYMQRNTLFDLPSLCPLNQFYQ